MSKKLNYWLILILMLVLAGSVAAQDPGRKHLKYLWTFEDGTLDDQVGQTHGEAVGGNIFVEDGDLVNLPNASDVGDSWVELPGDVLDLASYNDVAVAAWFTPESVQYPVEHDLVFRK